MNGYEPLLQDTDSGPMCRDCLQWCYLGTPAPPCDVDGCTCPRCEQARRAIELDDREPNKLHVIANEMESERHGDVPGRYNADDLTAERFGKPTRRAA